MDSPPKRDRSILNIGVRQAQTSARRCGDCMQARMMCVVERGSARWCAVVRGGARWCAEESWAAVSSKSSYCRRGACC